MQGFCALLQHADGGGSGTFRHRHQDLRETQHTGRHLLLRCGGRGRRPYRGGSKATPLTAQERVDFGIGDVHRRINRALPQHVEAHVAAKLVQVDFPRHP